MNLEIQKDLVRAFKMLTILRFYQQQEKLSYHISFFIIWHWMKIKLVYLMKQEDKRLWNWNVIQIEFASFSKYCKNIILSVCNIWKKMIFQQVSMK